MDDAPAPIDDAILDDLRRRLRSFRPPPLPPDPAWQRGTDLGYLSDLVRHWADEYDWRSAEGRIRSLPWVRVVRGRGAIRAIHQRARDSGAPVAALVHGWPDSVLRFERVLPLLTDVNVVAVCLPGFPFAEASRDRDQSPRGMADTVADLMSALGYDRFVVSGGDIGSSVARSLAVYHPDRVIALHLTDIPASRAPAGEASFSAEEVEYLAAARRWRAQEGGYLLQQATKPSTVAMALSDSPSGLASWIVEKLRGWSDCGGDVESVFPRADLLTWITAYWVHDAIGTSFAPYLAPVPSFAFARTPTVVSCFAHDLVVPPRAYAERFFDVREWVSHGSGGHFAAWERPHAYVADLREALAFGA